jgi:hypothetical protein
VTVFLENMQFADWRTSEKDGQWTDVFIQRISPLAGLPPLEYGIGMYRLASLLTRKRHSASLWVQVDGPGRWYRETLRSVLRWKGKLPIAVTAPSCLAKPGLYDYVVFPYLEPKRPPDLKRFRAEALPVSQDALRCLQILGRIERGGLDEIASLAGLTQFQAQNGLAILEHDGLVLRAEEKVKKKKPLITWQIRREGLHLALRSWGIPREVPFARRKELALSDPAGEHRRISRLWPLWLCTAWQHVQVWTGWSEVGLPGLPQIPDALAWGNMGGLETLFWLEVDSGHGSREEIRKKTRRRFAQAVNYSAEKELGLVFALLGRDWVCEAARPAFVGLPNKVAVTMGNWQEFGRLPLTEWGRVEW